MGPVHTTSIRFNQGEISGVIGAQNKLSRRRKEEQEAKRLAEMEEAAMQIEEKYSGLADEAEQKTKKLKKLWKKFQEV